MDDVAGVERFGVQSGALMVAPFVSRERFAQLVGLPVGVIVGMINKGYLPRVSACCFANCGRLEIRVLS